MKVPEDVAGRGHLDLAIGLNEGTNGETDLRARVGNRVKDGGGCFCTFLSFFSLETTEANNLSRRTSRDFCQK